MRWTVPLTKLALETRFKDAHILNKFAKKTSDTKKIRATWEATVNTFLEHAMLEEAWGEGKEGQTITVTQFKNKINAIRKAYRAKRIRMLSTGNRASASSSEDDEVGSNQVRSFPEMPTNYLLIQGEAVDKTGRPMLTCDPLNVRAEYRRELGNELAALWPLLCDVFSSNPGLTGEAIIESGMNASDGIDIEDQGNELSELDIESEDECSDTPSEARAHAKARAKANKSQQPCQTLNKRPLDLLNDTLRDGFSSFKRIFKNRQSNQPNSSMVVMVNRLASTIEDSSAKQQAASQAICQSIASLQQTTVEMFKEMINQLKGPNPA